jgi:hypothetical protein
MREAIVSLSDEEIEALGFGDLVSMIRAAGIRDVEMFEDEGVSCKPQLELEATLDEGNLESLDCVDDWQLVTENEETYLYLLELTATELPEDAAEDHEELLGSCETAIADRGVLLSLVGSQEAIRNMLRNFQDVGASPELRKLAEYEGQRDTLDALTDRQLEALETAYDMGFYNVPREATTDDVAAELDIDSATLSEHLQRAERNLLSQQLSTAK